MRRLWRLDRVDRVHLSPPPFRSESMTRIHPSNPSSVNNILPNDQECSVDDRALCRFADALPTRHMIYLHNSWIPSEMPAAIPTLHIRRWRNFGESAVLYIQVRLSWKVLSEKSFRFGFDWWKIRGIDPCKGRLSRTHWKRCSQGNKISGSRKLLHKLEFGNVK